MVLSLVALYVFVAPRDLDHPFHSGLELGVGGVLTQIVNPLRPVNVQPEPEPPCAHEECPVFWPGHPDQAPPPPVLGPP